MKRFWNVIIALLILFILPLQIFAMENENYIINLNFDNFMVNEALTRSKLNQMGIQTSNWDNGLAQRTLIVPDSTGNELEIFYPQGSYGSKQTGTQVEINLVASDEYYMEYNFRFDENFSWGSEHRGGKLPGITGGDRCNPNFHCTGENGFSARFMWRYDGYGELYLYHTQKPGSYGETIPFIYPSGERVQFERGREYNIKEYVKLNSSPEVSDGQVIVWIDDQIVVNKDNLHFISNEQQIDTFFFSTFHGGSNASWAPENDSYLYIDDITVATYPFF